MKKINHILGLKIEKVKEKVRILQKAYAIWML